MWCVPKFHKFLLTKCIFRTAFWEVWWVDGRRAWTCCSAILRSDGITCWRIHWNKSHFFFKKIRCPCLSFSYYHCSERQLIRSENLASMKCENQAKCSAIWQGHDFVAPRDILCAKMMAIRGNFRWPMECPCYRIALFFDNFRFPGSHVISYFSKCRSRKSNRLYVRSFGWDSRASLELTWAASPKNGFSCSLPRSSIRTTVILDTLCTAENFSNRTLRHMYPTRDWCFEYRNIIEVTIFWGMFKYYKGSEVFWFSPSQPEMEQALQEYHLVGVVAFYSLCLWHN